MRRPEHDDRYDDSGNHGRSLGDTLAWLDRHVNLEAIERGVAGRAGEPTLERIAALVAAMGNPECAAPVVHVTGTNGKGSTTRLIARLLEAQGLVVGTYTSPHLEALNERIARGGEPISDTDLAELLDALEELETFLVARGGATPTWFELVTAAAFRYFADSAVDVTVLEVGLGGRYDATNVAHGAVCAVTNVELDHCEILGPTRADIAREKAGIIKAGSLAVIGEQDPELVEIFAEQARAVAAEGLWRRGVEFACRSSQVAHGGRVVDLETPGARYDEVFLALHGAHQGENAAIALACAEAFFGGPLAEEVVTEAFAHVTVPGRLEVVGRRPLLLLDGAHNAAGAAALGAALAEDFAAAERVVLVLGCLRGRDPGELLDALGTDRVAAVVACAPPSPRALRTAEIADAAFRRGLRGEVAETVGDALGVALGLAGEHDVVVATGSLYVVGAARAAARRLASRRP